MIGGRSRSNRRLIHGTTTFRWEAPPVVVTPGYGIYFLDHSRVIFNDKKIALFLGQTTIPTRGVKFLDHRRVTGLDGKGIIFLDQRLKGITTLDGSRMVMTDGSSLKFLDQDNG